jgi:hypothetical protein
MTFSSMNQREPDDARPKTARAKGMRGSGPKRFMFPFEIINPLAKTRMQEASGL